MFFRFASLARYGGAGLIAVLLAGLAIAPFSRNVIEQWSRRDVEARSRLVFNAIHSSLDQAVKAHGWKSLEGIFENVALDERILAVGLCDEAGALIASTKSMPKSFSCEKVARSEPESFSSISSDGRRLLAAAFPVSGQGRREYLVLLTDLSFVDARSGQALAYLVALIAIASIVLAGVAALLMFLAARKWMRSLQRAVAQVRRGDLDYGLPGARSPIEAEIHKLLRETDHFWASADRVEWSPRTLQDLLHKALPDAEVLVVSNREPYIHNHSGNRIVVQTPASGLVSALEPIMRACGGVWIAHGSGTADRETVDEHDRIRVPEISPSYSLRRVWITDEEQDGYYYGFANEGLWPLCHIAFVKPVFRASDWQAYRAINRRFAEAVVAESRSEDPIVLVHDYHFALAPKMIRERLPKATIILFWHIPWPNAETFSICPWKEEIIEGLLGSTIVGFHTQFHCNNFVESVDRFLESRIDRETLTVVLAGHETKVQAYPISIEWPPAALAAVPASARCRSEIRESLGVSATTKIALGVERFDYTKGILDRMRAIDMLLSLDPSLKERFVFVQVAAPTRSKLASYASLQAEAEALAAEINQRHGSAGYRPVRLIARHHEPDEVFKLFRAADICIVSSLHDGMNLVAKEFVASREDNTGVLVLSSFAGASREMSEALIVNPYHTMGTADTIARALSMPVEEQAERMMLMRQQIRENNVYRWAGRMIIDAIRSRKRQKVLAWASPPTRPGPVAASSRAPTAVGSGDHPFARRSSQP
ncbi:alpha,alpha-trehalose-phosphate synthase (UDP-forming) [Bradyrhizobium sp. USDA 10063]